MSFKVTKFRDLKKDQQKKLIIKYSRASKRSLGVVEEALSYMYFSKTLQPFLNIPNDQIVDMIDSSQQDEMLTKSEIEDTLKDIIEDLISINTVRLSKDDKLIFEGVISKLNQVHDSAELLEMF